MSLGITAAFSVLVAMVLIGCTQSISREKLVGTYHLQHPQAGMIELILLSDGSFAETIRPVNGQLVRREGRWLPPDEKNRALGLEGLWIPREFAPDYILMADEMNKGGVQYTAPGYWVGKPEQRLGKVTIPVFPDADIKFERVSP
ncbi:MAG: hypothetical protein INH40_12825 [Acidobacteriaceae bacterium]|nr:hypothetical protein [Acidobacteriaceae bacterium]